MILEYQKEKYKLTSDKKKFDRRAVHQLLSLSYWAKDIPFDIVCRSIENSECYGLFEGERQLGIIRIISDWATFAYIADFIIAEEVRGKGLGKWMMNCVLKHPLIQDLKLILLATENAHALYSQFGFCSVKKPERYMEIFNPDIYRRPD
jgi:GNAT superfamily N-acetyltransferase